ncbi:MAG TPA: chemotaxis protein CheW [Tissierellaceae bacterium]
MQIIIFTLDKEYYAISTEYVEEIIRDITTTKVPNTYDYIEGLINLRGNVVTLINLSKLLGKDNNLSYNDVIIINNEIEKMGIMVNDVREVIDIDEKSIQKVSKKPVDGVIGIIENKDSIVNILDMNLLLINEG